MRSSAFVRLAFALLGLAATSSACSGKAACSDLRAEAERRKAAWAACDPTLADPRQCVVMAGIAKDCTGVFACAWAIQRPNTSAAEVETLKMAADSVDCHACAQPSCLSANAAYCDARTPSALGGTCRLVVDGLDGGT